jgi:hypothetical protein
MGFSGLDVDEYLLVENVFDRFEELFISYPLIHLGPSFKNLQVCSIVKCCWRTWLKSLHASSMTSVSDCPLFLLEIASL